MPAISLRIEKIQTTQKPDTGTACQMVGVRRETIMRLEAGKYNPSLKLAVDISRVVGAPIEDIFIFD